MSQHDEHEQMVADCEARESKLSDWVRTFVDSISAVLAKRPHLAALGVHPDVWIDDNPHWVDGDIA